jgi:hypothetical protein
MRRNNNNNILVIVSHSTRSKREIVVSHSLTNVVCDLRLSYIIHRMSRNLCREKKLLLTNSCIVSILLLIIRKLPIQIWSIINCHTTITRKNKDLVFLSGCSFFAFISPYSLTPASIIKNLFIFFLLKWSEMWNENNRRNRNRFNNA